jgi:circadian clock protein KaiC
LRSIELGGERNRGLYVLKSRGMAHSNQIREFLLTPRGIDLLDVYAGGQGVLTGSMRLAQEAREREEEEQRMHEADARRRVSERRRRAIEAQIAALRADLETEEEADRRAAAGERDRLARVTDVRREMARSRKADASKGSASNGRSSARTGA